ncbi:hypothetical protein IST455A_01008 [Burkholderia multivorans]|uniref:hypothetical protein n=1 Tax=Burkholderia multivorans TaxID=87883 RepID=UPI00123BA842|nr:hypothetical protein [Burkholderia multivorans]MBU9247620.1 hypothetical protein [Burkholderia multivorans]QET31725.1 hypothetical protein FOB31_18930 [Burkholderia multivorans]QET40855.1 hypothetical protein FOB30_24930 [Burkholderia multivorans]CAB5280113.1 hypothetical protein IST495A_03475 [Burkholderia multivorans]CAB5300730.1 hypothetical protein IST419_01135 [Burkholderia multivorans]
MDAATAVEYFEFADLLPGVKHFHCDRMRASLSVDACAANWNAASDRREGACSQCKGCRIGAVHAGYGDANLHPLHATLTCARCLRMRGRLVHKHLCLSCYNRHREYLIGRNSKGTAPVMHPPLALHTVSYIAAGELRTRTIEHATGRREVIAAILRDERDAVTFAEDIDRAYAVELQARGIVARSVAVCAENLSP